METKNIKLLLEYEGTNYSGWQRQKNSPSIQQTVEEAIEKITHNMTEVIGCSRTDAGVHARGFVCNFKTTCTIPSVKFKDAINSKLPKDIVVLNSEEVSLDFHSRYNAKAKEYSYRILNRREPAAINRDYLYHYKEPLDMQKMSEAASYFIGTHDFKAFRKLGSSVKTTVRTINKIEVINDEPYITIIVNGNGFLYNMVRMMAGTLLLIGCNKIAKDSIVKKFYSDDKNEQSLTLPAKGLCLEQVFY